MNKGFSIRRVSGYTGSDKFSISDLDEICGKYSSKEFEDYTGPGLDEQIVYVINHSDLELTNGEIRLLDAWAKIPQSLKIQIRNIGITKL